MIGTTRQARLLVMTGLHAGAEYAFPNRRFNVGSEEPADILLGDEGLTPLHLAIEPGDGGEMQISVLSDGVMIEGTPLSSGETVAASFPVEITIEAVTLRCEAGEVVERISRWRPISKSKGVSAASVAATIVIAVSIGAAMMQTSTAALAPIKSRHGALVRPGQENGSAASQYGLSSSSDADLQNETARELRVRSIKDVTLEVSSGVVTAHGHIAPAQAAALHEVEIWFDRRFGEQAVFMSEVAEQAAPTASLSIDAVWNGKDPNVVVHGKRYFAGDSLPSGEVVDRIMPHRISFSRSGGRYEMDY